MREKFKVIWYPRRTMNHKTKEESSAIAEVSPRWRRDRVGQDKFERVEANGRQVASSPRRRKCARRPASPSPSVGSSFAARRAQLRNIELALPACLRGLLGRNEQGGRDRQDGDEQTALPVTDGQSDSVGGSKVPLPNARRNGGPKVSLPVPLQQ